MGAAGTAAAAAGAGPLRPQGRHEDPPWEGQVGAVCPLACCVRGQSWGHPHPRRHGAHLGGHGVRWAHRHRHPPEAAAHHHAGPRARGVAPWSSHGAGWVGAGDQGLAGTLGHLGALQGEVRAVPPRHQHGHSLAQVPPSQQALEQGRRQAHPPPSRERSSVDRVTEQNREKTSPNKYLHPIINYDHLHGRCPGADGC